MKGNDRKRIYFFICFYDKIQGCLLFDKFDFNCFLLIYTNCKRGVEEVEENI